jgi:hypothetical protein
MDEELKYVFDRLEEEEKIITFYKSKKGKENKLETEKDFFGMRFVKNSLKNTVQLLNSKEFLKLQFKCYFERKQKKVLIPKIF